jgi:hypothetical protein
LFEGVRDTELDLKTKNLILTLPGLRPPALFAFKKSRIKKGFLPTKKSD